MTKSSPSDRLSADRWGWRICWLLAASAGGLFPLYAQTTPDAPAASPSIPASNSQLATRALLSWETPGIDPRMRSMAKEPLQLAWRQLALNWLGSEGLPLADAPNNRVSQGNAAKLSREVRVSGQWSTSDSELLQPIWCKIGNAQVIALQVVDGYTGTIRRMTHFASPQAVGAPAAQDRYDWLNTAVSGAWQRLSETADVRQRQNASPSKLAMENASQSTRLDRGSHRCLTLILAEKLHPERRVQAEIGMERVQHLRWQRQVDEVLARANRTIAVEWLPQPKPASAAMALPTDFRANFRYSEAVFGSASHQDRLQPYRIDVRENRIEFALHPGLLQFVLEQDQSLAQDQLPQTSHVYGAWVYLDRGRAYGLRLNDRLTSGSGDTEIRGHVIGFVGSGAKLKSPRGFPILEGAIVFVRKGQQLTKLGQEWRFDETEYPTDFPPKANDLSRK
jgi:hypothetical protein